VLPCALSDHLTLRLLPPHCERDDGDASAVGAVSPRDRKLESWPFSDADWIAIEYGIQETDSEAGEWFEYPVGRVVVSLALEPGGEEMVSVKVAGAAGPERQQIGWLGDILRTWHLSTRGQE
jgi:hypothetical protein